jgi:DNA-directed RNA polymerase delta subunit
MNAETKEQNIAQSEFPNLAAIIYVFGINKSLWGIIGKMLTDEGTGILLSLAEIVNDWELKPRHWEFLELRSGFTKKHSYDEIAQSVGGIGRARVQQVLKKTLKRLEEGLYRVVPFLTLLEVHFSSLWPSADTCTSINSAIYAQQDVLAEIGWEPMQGADVRRLLLALRSLTNAGMLTIPSKLPELSYFACTIVPEVLKNPRIAARIAAQEEAENYRWTYERVVEAVLENADEPMHYTDIANKAQEMHIRSDINLKAIHNILLAKPDKFALVGQGTYGLTARGFVSVDNYVNIIADGLKESGHTLTMNEISYYVNLKRPIKPSSLQMTLDLHPRFYRTSNKTYGLRAWLPPREKQTLRTSTWLVEDADSIRRLEKALERGYDVDTIVASDKSLPA